MCKLKWKLILFLFGLSSLKKTFKRYKKYNGYRKKSDFGQKIVDLRQKNRCKICCRELRLKKSQFGVEKWE
jgi:hypothetical protein